MNTHSALRMVLVAGESSGDQLGAVLLQGAQHKFPDMQAAGILGGAMQAAGAQAWWQSQSLAVRGYFEPIKHLPRILSMRKELIHRTVTQKPDVFIGIDAPDFNLGVEKQLKAQGIPTMHYVSPSIWAWRPKRIEKIRAAVDHMLLIFPFEQAIYKETGIAASYVGHPFAQQIPMQADTTSARRALGLSNDAFVLAILPGSRGSEIEYNAPNFLCAAQLFSQQYLGTVQVVLPVAHAHLRARLVRLQNEHAPNLSVHYVDATESAQARQVMASADATLVASGTASLEVALYKKPSVISYRTSWLSVQIYKKVALQPWIGLPNILTQSHLIPEVLQDDASPEGLVHALLHEIERYAQDAHVTEQLQDLHRSLIADTPTLCAQAIAQVCGK